MHNSDTADSLNDVVVVSYFPAGSRTTRMLLDQRFSWLRSINVFHRDLLQRVAKHFFEVSRGDIKLPVKSANLPSADQSHALAKMQVAKVTDSNHSLCLLKDAIIQGWPETIKEVPTEKSTAGILETNWEWKMSSYSKVLKCSFLHHCKKTSCHSYTKPIKGLKRFGDD